MTAAFASQSPPASDPLFRQYIEEAVAKTAENISPLYRLDAFDWTVLAVYFAVLFLLSLYALAYAYLTFTKGGRTIYAVGSNAEAARAAGLNVLLYSILPYVISGALAAVGWWTTRRRGRPAMPWLVPPAALALAVGAWQYRSLPSETGPRLVWWALPAVAVVCSIAAVVAERRARPRATSSATRRASTSSAARA